LHKFLLIQILVHVRPANSSGLLMHFCDSNHEATQMQQEEKQQHQRPGNNCMWWEYENITNSRFSKLMIVF